ncbi:MAG: hypothetical protein NWF05_07905 [Candidatus Bathyarchaeota archaeon]|nr:hypothetical protein [Candidatus Bathyarchaeota archaeon]
MSEKSGRLKIVTFFLIGILVGIGFTELYFSVNAPDVKPSLEHLYRDAIEDAMVAKPSEIYNGLTPITTSNHNLNWTGEAGNESVLVVTFTKYASSYPLGETVNTTWGETWVTVVPEIRTFFKTQDANMNVTLRALQLLGLPPNNTNTYFVEMWVNPQALFRPAPDNEINDTSAQLDFPESATADYKTWFNNNIIYSYFPERYPWTRLGYTYDWGNTKGHVGLSEFVLKQNSLVTVESVTPTQEYLKPGT